MSIEWNVAGVATMVSLCVFTNTGCSTPVATAPRTPDHAVLVDFYSGAKTASACSGTLVSPNVVLTAAHCAQGSDAARVTAPASGKKAMARTFYVYDWDTRPAAENHLQEHDLALVVLDTPITIGKYASLEAGDCTGCKISRVSRLRSKTTIRAKLNTSAVMRVGKDAPRSRPYDLYVPHGSKDAGGALVRTDAKGRGRVVGVMIGTGGLSKGGYAVRLDDEDTRAWIVHIISVNRRPARSSTVSTKALHPLDEGDEYAEESSPPPEESEPAAEDTTTYEEEEPVTQPDEQPEAPGQEEVDPGGRVDNAGDLDESESTETTEQPATDEAEPTDDDDAPGTEAPKDELDVEPQAPSKLQGYQGVDIKTDAPGETGLITTETGSGWVAMSGSEKDKRIEAQSKIYREAHDDAYTITAHGWPGSMTAVPDADKLKAIGSDPDHPSRDIILSSCFGGKDATSLGGHSNAGVIADKAGVSPDRVLGCTGYVGTNGNEQLCAGQWVDGDGNVADFGKRKAYKLKECPAAREDGDKYLWGECGYQ